MRPLIIALALTSLPAIAGEATPTINLACVYTSGAQGGAQLKVVEENGWVTITDGALIYEGKADPYEIRGALQPPSNAPAMKGLLKINRTTGIAEQTYIVDGKAATMIARCEPAKPKF